MRILFLSDNFPPETNAPAIRTHEHTAAWSRQNHDVTVVTCAPNFPTGEVFDGYKNRYTTEWYDGVRVQRVWSYITRNQGTFRRTLDYVSFAASGIARSLMVEKPDVVIATSPQFFAALAGYFVARVRRAPFVFELRDLWPESVTAVGAIRDTFWLRPFYGLARFLYRRADLLIPVTHSFADHLRSHGVPDDRICVVTNGIEPEAIEADEASVTRAREQIPGDAFVCSYVGTLGMAHGLETILEAAHLTRDETDILYLIVGDGADREVLERRIKTEQVENVLLLGARPRPDALNLVGASDVAMVMLKNEPLFETVIPSKVFEAMALRKPIALGVSGESKRLVVDEARCGLAFEPGNARELVSLLKSLRDSPDLRAKLGEAGYRTATTKFRRSTLARRMLEAIEELVANDARNKP